jgi:hypothetical protein
MKEREGREVPVQPRSGSEERRGSTTGRKSVLPRVPGTEEPTPPDDAERPSWWKRLGMLMGVHPRINR